MEFCLYFLTPRFATFAIVVDIRLWFWQCEAFVNTLCFFLNHVAEFKHFSSTGEESEFTSCLLGGFFDYRKGVSGKVFDPVRSEELEFLRSPTSLREV